MFGIGTPELLVILVVALVVLGPKRLPEVARSLGKGLAELRKATSGLTDELTNARVMLEDEVRGVKGALKTPAARSTVDRSDTAASADAAPDAGAAKPADSGTAAEAEAPSAAIDEAAPRKDA